MNTSQPRSNQTCPLSQKMNSEKKQRSDARVSSSRSLTDILVDGVLFLVLSFADLKERATLYERTSKRLLAASRNAASLTRWPVDLTPLLGDCTLHLTGHRATAFLKWLKLHNNPRLRGVRLCIDSDVNEEVAPNLAIVSAEFGGNLKLLQLHGPKGNQPASLSLPGNAHFIVDPASFLNHTRVEQFLISNMRNLQWLQLGMVMNYDLTVLCRLTQLRGLVITTTQLDILDGYPDIEGFLTGLELLSVTFTQHKGRWVYWDDDNRRVTVNGPVGIVGINNDWSTSRLRHMHLHFPPLVSVKWYAPPPLAKNLVTGKPEINTMPLLKPGECFPFHLYFPECNDLK